ncbi:hypothetical protein V6N13_072538 [Hibiscus sabdariffa]
MRMEGGSDPETDETITTTLHPHSLLRGLHTFFGFELWCGSFLEECGKDEIMEIISLNITLTGETEPNVELGHLLAIKMEVVRVRVWLATQPLGPDVSFEFPFANISSWLEI